MEKFLWILVIHEKHEIKYTTKLFTYMVHILFFYTSTFYKCNLLRCVSITYLCLNRQVLNQILEEVEEVAHIVVSTRNSYTVDCVHQRDTFSHLICRIKTSI